MVNNTSLNEKFLPALQSVCPELQHIAYFADDGDILWKSPEWRDDFTGHILQKILDSKPVPETLRVDKSHVTLVAAPQQTKGSIALLGLVSSDPIDASARGKMQSTIDLVFQSNQVINEYVDEISQQEAEINDLAHELAGRYEELNLVYSSESNSVLPSHGRNALEEIVSNAVSFLDVDAATLLFPEKGLELTELQNPDHAGKLAVLLEKLGTTIFDYIQRHQGAIVANDKRDFQSLGINLDMKCKLIIQPLLNFDQNTIGMLALINYGNHEDFSNSDRNLCGVLSSKATSIVLQNFDPLTGLENATSFDVVLQEAFRLTRKNMETHAVAKINVDRLAVVNDLGGLSFGDELLRKIAQILTHSTRSKDTVARLAGDSFGLLLRNCTLNQAKLILEKIGKEVAKIELRVDKHIIDSTISAGLGPLNADVNNVSSIYSNLESALAEAKAHGRDNIVAYEVDDEYLLARKEQLKWVSITQTALHENRFEVYGQPIVSLGEPDSVPHYEVLVRMLGDSGELIPPNQFIPVAENYFLMSQIDRWVINRSFKLLSDHLADQDNQPISISVNLSGQSIVEHDLFGYIKERFQHYNLPPDLVRFEITESAAIANLADAQSFINRITRMGCQFALDDFGSGYSSFNYLKNLHVDYLKIDGSFVRQIVNDPVSSSMVSAINEVGHAMNIKTIAEFVETQSIINALSDLNVDFGQGYAFAKPIPLIECLHLDDETVK